MKITKFLSICAIVASAFSFSSCNSEMEGTTTFGDFVNYMGQSEDGYSRFEYNPTLTPNGGIIIKSKVSWGESLTPYIGTRVVAYFQIDINQELVNNITLESLGVFKLYTFDNVKIQEYDPQVISAPFYLTSATRSGNYLDICALANPKNTELQLICDPKSLEPTSSVAELHLIYTDNDQQSSTDTQYFASFDISSVLSYQNIKNLRLMLYNSNGNGEYLLPARNE